MHSLSLKWRIGICMTILLFVIIAAISVVAYIGFRKSQLRNLDNRLQSNVDAIIALIESEDSLQESRKAIHAFLNPKNDSNNSVYRIWLENEKGYFAASLSSQEWLSDFIFELAKVPSVKKYQLINAQNEAEHYRLVWAKLPDPRQSGQIKHPVNIMIAIHSGNIIAEMGRFLEALLILGAITILGSLGLTFWILHWGLKPVANLTIQMNEVSAKTLEKLSTTIPNSPTELRPFVRAWDRMLGRITLAIQQQRRFTADASHELRTPLTIAKSTLQTALSQKRSSEAYESAMEETLEDLSRVQHLVEQLLALAHLDDIIDQSNWEILDLGVLVADVCEQYQPLAGQRNCTLKYQVYSARINGSDEQLRRLFANLIDNAIKYGPAGSQVLVSMQTLSECINITIHDQGGNIPQIEQQKIFERFYRIRKIGKQSSTGSGLGLALAQEIVQKHQGSITAHSDPKTGTDFVVTLPCGPDLSL